MKTAFFSALTLSLFVLVSGEAKAQTKELTLTQALAIAQGSGSNLGTLVFSRQENKAGSKIWGFYFMTEDGTLIEKEVHGTSGRVLVSKEIKKIEDKSDVNPPVTDPSTNPTDTKVANGQNKNGLNPQVIETLKIRTRTKFTNVQYLDIALEKNPGIVTGFEVILEQDQLRVRVSGRADDGTPWRVLVDLATGKIVSGQ